MPPADDIQTGLDRIWSSDFVQKNPKKSYQAYHPDEYNRVKAYVEGGEAPSPWPTTLLGDGLALVERGQRYLQGELPPPPPSGYPASYFTGPLGQSNILPTKQGAFLITWGIYDGTSATSSWTQQRDALLGREGLMGRRYDGLMTTDTPDVWGENRMQWIRDHGSIPIVAGYGYSLGGVSGIAAGQKDAVIDAQADHWNSLGVPIMVRLFHEFNLPGVPYTCLGVSAQTWIDAWKRVVERVHTRAPKVGFWWCPTEGDARAQTDAVYPGDAYVDWVGTDSYNWVLTSETGKWATPMHGGWAEFWEVFDYVPGSGYSSRHSAYGPRKPFIVGETATKYDPQFPAKKGQWYRNIPAAARNMEYLRGVAIFDQNVEGSEPGNNWYVPYPTSNPDPLAGFVTMAKDPWFNTRA